MKTNSGFKEQTITEYISFKEAETWEHGKKLTKSTEREG